MTALDIPEDRGRQRLDAMLFWWLVGSECVFVAGLVAAIAGQGYRGIVAGLIGIGTCMGALMLHICDEARR